MGKRNPLKDIVAKGKNGKRLAITSVCSSNAYVLEAAMERALPRGELLLVEATANQVNQLGGYTGMRPADFASSVSALANRVNFPRQRLLLGGDHLGPLVWRDRGSDEAMALAKDLVREFVAAGFNKIHIDTSMPLGDDHNSEFGELKVAERGAQLCEVCERAYAELAATGRSNMHPAYVIGSEVPTPGGMQNGDEGVSVTTVEDFRKTVKTFREAFANRGLSGAWSHVVAVVVQLGVEFGDDEIREYDRSKAAHLIVSLDEYPELAFEGHSTDYQTKEALREMVEDGVSILKVGPALTFALREALFSLGMMENVIAEYDKSIEPSHFVAVLDRAMMEKPGDWERHYNGTTGEQIAFKRKYSFSDRCRYYLPETSVQASIDRLIANLRKSEPPLSLVSQFMPRQYSLIRSGLIDRDPESLIKSRIAECLDEYGYATRKD
jgi:D-tagatose-1,6-bisphosphate aldolase subunit GatZ/KbaZ